MLHPAVARKFVHCLIVLTAAYHDFVYEPITGAMKQTTLIILQLYHQRFTHIHSLDDIRIFLTFLKIVVKPMIQDDWLSSCLGAWRKSNRLPSYYKYSFNVPTICFYR